MSKPLAWSYTALTSFETCPRRHFLLRVAKKVTEPRSEELRWGEIVHGALEKRLNGTSPLPPTLHYLEPLVHRITTCYGKRVVEQRLCVDNNLHPVPWYAKNAWCRGVIDAGLVGPENAVLFDWKTGRRKPDNDQLKLFAALMFAHEPYLQEIHTAFVWVKEKKLDREKFTHKQVGELWNEFLPRVKRLELAHQNNEWAPKPSGLCGKWCPVTKQDCPFGR